MSAVADARQALADLLTAELMVTVRPREPSQPTRKVRDGWVRVSFEAGGVTLKGFTELSIPLEVVVILGADLALAEDLFDELAGPLLRTVAESDLPAHSVAVRPAVLVVGDVAPSNLHALVLSLTVEVDS